VSQDRIHGSTRVNAAMKSRVPRKLSACTPNDQGESHPFGRTLPRRYLCTRRLMSLYELLTGLSGYEWVGLVVGFLEHVQNLTTNNYDSLTKLHTPMITVTTAHIKSSQPLLSVA
jgi:hypothetical protein